MFNLIVLMIFFIFIEKYLVKHLALLLLLILSACQSKEDELALDFVKIDIYSVQTSVACSFIIDFNSNTLIFDNYGQMPNYPEEGDIVDSNLFNSELPLDFEYFKLNKDEINTLKKSLNYKFLKSVKENNDLYIKSTNNDFIAFEGLMYQFKIQTNNNIFTTKNYIILSNEDLDQKISHILSTAKKKSNSNKNKKYINFISNYLQ